MQVMTPCFKAFPQTTSSAWFCFLCFHKHQQVHQSTSAQASKTSKSKQKQAKPSTACSLIKVELFGCLVKLKRKQCKVQALSNLCLTKNLISRSARLSCSHDVMCLTTLSYSESYGAHGTIRSMQTHANIPPGRITAANLEVPDNLHILNFLTDHLLGQNFAHGSFAPLFKVIVLVVIIV